MTDKEVLIKITVDSTAAQKSIEKQTLEITKLTDANDKLKKKNKELAKSEGDTTKERAKNSQEIAKNTAKIQTATKVRKDNITAIKSSNNSYGAMKLRLREVAVAIDKVDLSTKKGQQSIRALRTEQNKLNTSLKSGEASGASFGRNVGNYKNVLNSAASSMTSFNLTLLASPIGLIVAALGSLVLVGKQAFSFFKQYEVVMSKVKAVTQATNEEFQILRDSTIEYGESSKFTAKEVAQLQLELAKLGKTTPEIVAMTGSILDLAVATDSELGETASIVAKTLNQFRLEATDTTRVTDVMAQAFVSSALDINKFEEAMKKAGPIARLSGKSFEETTAIVASLADAGVDASNIGTSLRDVFSDLAKSGESWDSALERIKNSTDRVKTANDIFGKTSLTVTALLSENIDKVSDLTASLNDAEGASAAMAEIVGNNLQGDLDRLSSSWEGLIARGGWLNTVFRLIIVATKQFIDDVKDIPLAVERMVLVSEKLFGAMAIFISEAFLDVQESIQNAMLSLPESLRVGEEALGKSIIKTKVQLEKSREEQEKGSERIAEINNKLEEHRLRQVKELANVFKEGEDAKTAAAFQASQKITEQDLLEAEKKKQLSAKEQKAKDKQDAIDKQKELDRLARARKNDEDQRVLDLTKQRDSLTLIKEKAEAEKAILDEKFEQEDLYLREKLAKENELSLKDLNSKIANKQLTFASVEELTYEHAQKIIKINNDADKEINESKEKIAEKEEKRTIAEKKLRSDSAKSYLTILGSVLQTAGNLAGDNFELQKAFSIGQAIINTAQGVTQAFAQGGPLGFATGASVAVAGAVQVAKIAATTPDTGGGGGVAPVSGTTPTPQIPTTAADTAQAENEALEAAISRIGLSVSVTEINEAQVSLSEAESGSSI